MWPRAESAEPWGLFFSPEKRSAIVFERGGCGRRVWGLRVGGSDHVDGDDGARSM